MHKQRIALLISSCVGVAGVFLPWIKVPIVGTINGLRGDGEIILALFALIFFGILLGKRNFTLSKSEKFFCASFGLINALIGVWKILQFSELLNSNTDENMFSNLLYSSVSIEIGLFLVVLAGIAIFYASVNEDWFHSDTSASS